MVKQRISKAINLSTLAAGAMLAIVSTLGHAATDTARLGGSGKIYVGILGGLASPSSYHADMYGSAFISEASGGPLAVNAFGSLDGGNAGFFGGQLGFQWADIAINPSMPGCALAPAIEVEGLSLGKTSFTGHLINNTARIPEHDFDVTFPTRMGVYLANAVVNLNSSRLGRFHPYVGVGIGGALTRITTAMSEQRSPPEANLNHFNTNVSDSVPTFAGQVKVGLNADITSNISVFAEYRWLYLATTTYSFGSTVYPGHAETTAWQVQMDPRNYNMGAVGIQFSV